MNPLSHLIKIRGWEDLPLIRLMPDTSLCLSQASTWVSNDIWYYCVQWVKVKDGCSFCWYWWNCWPSLFKLSFHNLKLYGFFSAFWFERTWWRLFHKRLVCTIFDIYVFTKERIILTYNHPPVNFVNAIYLFYVNQIICLCTINIGSVVYNSGLSNTIIFYSNVCYIYNDRQCSSENVHWLYIYIYYIPQQWHFIFNSCVIVMFK